jgi:dephospho-CoA kinase
MKYYIGVVGEKGSGKETFVSILSEIVAPASVAHIRSSEILGETLDIWDIPRTRRNLQDLAIIMDKGFGKGMLTHAMEMRMRRSDADIVVYDGIRWDTDATMLRTFPSSILVYVTAPVRMRFERTKQRKEKAGEETTSFEKFLEEEKVATELDIVRIGNNADYIIENDGTLEKFKEKVEVFSRKMLSK